MNQHNKISYIEIPTTSLPGSKDFFKKAFGWSFVDYGDEYTTFSDQGVNGGFCKSGQSAASSGALVVLYSQNLEQTEADVVTAGGTIVKPVFSFPGGCRFHFCDPSGNEYAVWSEND